MRRRKINPKTYRPAAIRLARCWIKKSGIPAHVVGYDENDGFYIVLHCLSPTGVARRYSVPCAGASALKHEVNRLISDYWS